MRVKFSIPGLVFMLCLVIVMTGVMTAQTPIGFLYTNNSPQGANSVSRFEALDDCTLSLLGQTPTGGNGAGGGFFASDRLAVQGNCLFASNDGSNSISAFQLDATTGDLTAAGAPVPTGGVAGNGIALAVSPDGAFLYATNAGSSNISRFAIGEGCGLTAQPPLTALPAGSQPLDVAISPDGNCLAASLGSPPSRMVSFKRDLTTGALTPVTGSPFAVMGTGLPASLQFSSDGTKIYVGKSVLNAIAVVVLDVDLDTCALSSRAPVVMGGSNSNVARLNPAEDCLLVTSQAANAIAGFNVDGDGGLEFTGLFPGFPERAFISGLQFNSDGTCAYSTYHSPVSSVASFSVKACNANLLGATNTGAQPGLLQGMAFVPVAK